MNFFLMEEERREVLEYLISRVHYLYAAKISK
jgi:hypothetical protein